MDENEPFDPVADLRELARLAPAGTGRKLSFDQKCAAYAALYNGVKLSIVAEVFNLSRTSVSNLAGCREDNRPQSTMTVGDYAETFPSPSISKRAYKGRKPRYADIAAEFERLGEDEFTARYYTRAIAARIRNTIRENGD